MSPPLLVLLTVATTLLALFVLQNVGDAPTHNPQSNDGASLRGPTTVIAPRVMRSPLQPMCYSGPPRARQNCQGIAEGQIGLLKGAQTTLPLFATEHPSRRGRFWYHTLTDGNIPLKVGVTSEGRDCLQEIGCDEVFDNDTVQVPVLGGDWTVSLYPRFPYYR